MDKSTNETMDMDAGFVESELAAASLAWACAPREDDSILLGVDLSRISQPNVAKGIGIVDTDTHLSEPADLWTSRAPASMKDKVPYVRTAPHGAQMWYIGDEPVGPIGYSVIDNKLNKLRGGKTSLPTFDDMHSSAWTVKPRLELMDKFGIEAQLCFPNLGEAVRSDKLIKTVDSETAMTTIRIFNEWRAEIQAESDNRLFPLVMLPLWDQKLLVEEARRCIEEHKAVGFNMPDRPDLLGFPGWLSDYWTPFFELCSATKTPICFHVVSGIDFWSMMWDDYGTEMRMALVPTVFQMSHCVTLVNFLVSGLFDKYPGLKFYMVESGVGWVPFILESVDYQLEANGVVKNAKLQRKPSEYFHDHFALSFWFEEQGPRRVIEQLGPDNIMFETDFPHPTSLYPEMHSHIDASLKGLDRDVVKKLLRGNAVNFFNLPI